MIPNIARSGTSFRGAGKYYLHDKTPENERGDEDALEHLTSRERVAFTATRNCVHDDPEQAIDEMWATAAAQDELKREAGLKLGGRKCTNPVKTISLSWHPSETPTQEQMIETADSYLKKMGWSEHQALFVGHNDTEHPHIHIILNRVNPETGRVLDDRNDFKRSQEWALEYEKEQGRIFCEKRLDYELGAKDRTRPANDNIPHDIILLTRPSEQGFKHDEMTREQRDALERSQLKVEQRAEREAWFEDGGQLFKAARNAVWREVKEEYREDWKVLYAEKSERQDEAHAISGNAVSRAFYFAKRGEWDEARDAFADRHSVTDTVNREFAERFASLREDQRQEVVERQQLACEMLFLVRETVYKALLEQQQLVRDDMRELHAKGERADHLVTPVPHARVGEEALARANAPVPPAPDREAAEPAKDGVAALVPKIDFRDNQNSTLISIEFPQFPVSDDPEHDKIRDGALTGAADLGAGMVGGVASYLADQLGELFAPTPPEVREAREKTEDKARQTQEENRPVNPYLRHAGDAEQKARDEREREERERYWDDERERRRER